MTANSSALIHLKQDMLSELDERGVAVPQYRLDGKLPKTGIVHIGPGAFFRAHQAWFTHMAMQISGGDWGISCVSMHSSGVADALNCQDGLYCLAQLDNNTEYEVIGSINEVLVAGKEYQQVIERLINIDTKLVTLTITEKGYCLNNQGKLDMQNPNVLSDINSQDIRTTAIGLLNHALFTRWQQGLPCLSIISCDNVTDNGKKLRVALIAFAQQINAQFAAWLEDTLICPCTMVDSITPASDQSLKDSVSANLAIKDNWPIKRESFVQWVIEDILPEPKPSWDKVGAIFTNDVNGFEMGKLRLLNCPHSTLAYLGSLMGIETVFDAMQNKALVNFVEQLINNEVIPSLSSHIPKELHAKAYSNDILARFRNPSIRHLLSQIAWDGSQKLPMRILPVIQQNLLEGRAIDSLCAAVAAWMLFVRLRYQQSQELVDPLSEKLLLIAAACNDQAVHDIKLFLALDLVFTNELCTQERFVDSLQHAYTRLLPLLSEQSLNVL